jgi:hypothetical protein
LTVGQKGTFTLTIARSTSFSAGFDIAVDPAGAATLTATAATEQVVNNEVTHLAPLQTGTQVVVTFQAKAHGGDFQIYAAALAANGDNDTTGDGVGVATPLAVTAPAAMGDMGAKLPIDGGVHIVVSKDMAVGPHGNAGTDMGMPDGMQTGSCSFDAAPRSPLSLLLGFLVVARSSRRVRIRDRSL